VGPPLGLAHSSSQTDVGQLVTGSGWLLENDVAERGGRERIYSGPIEM